MMDPYHRSKEYSGVAWRGDMETARVDDVISLGSYLALDVTVYDLMVTNRTVH
jgi:hypothetical protein